MAIARLSRLIARLSAEQFKQSSALRCLILVQGSTRIPLGETCMTHVRSFLAALQVLALPLAAQSITPASVHSAIIGHWVGTLMYKDYRDSTKRVTLPTIMDAAPALEGGAALQFSYDDGPGKTVTSGDRFMLSADGGTLDWTGVKQQSPEIFRVVSLLHTDDAGTMQLVAEREGQDDDKPATLRETMTITRTEITILKEVRPTGSDFSFRHVYHLLRH